MVRGLDAFKRHFASFSNSYTVIGGTACELAMEEVGLEFRATKDIDIVLCIEALEEKFIEAFWTFVKMGGYQHKQHSTGKKHLYRFYGPRDISYPHMLEFFSRKPDVIPLLKEMHLTPIPISEEVSSLSAILLNDDYYRFIHEGKEYIEELPILAPTHLIPLKAHAWIKLSFLRDSGIHITEEDIRKHRNDVIRLYQLLSPDMKIFLPPCIEDDMQMFVEALKNASIDPKVLGLKNTNLNQIVSTLNDIYCKKALILS